MALEKRLRSTTADLERYQDLAKKLQKTITTTQNDLETAIINLQEEKRNNKELQAMVDTLSGNLELSGRKLEGIDVQYTQNKKELMENKLGLQKIVHENHSLKHELKEAQSISMHLQDDLDRRERDLQSQRMELSEARNTASSLAQKLDMETSSADSHRHQLEEYRAQLTSNVAENDKLMNDSQLIAMEVQNLQLKVTTTTYKQLSEKKADLHEREDEMRHLKQDNISLTRELTESKREVHSLVSFRTKLEDELKNKQSQLESEHTRALTVSILFNTLYT